MRSIRANIYLLIHDLLKPLCCPWITKDRSLMLLDEDTGDWCSEQ